VAAKHQSRQAKRHGQRRGRDVNFKPVWRKRNAERRPSEYKKHVAQLIKTLEELEEKTRPSGGAKTEEGKDLAAFEALQLAGMLVDALAGWALDHQIGLAIANLDFLPLGPSSLRNHPQYIATRSQVNKHYHEQDGGAVFSGVRPQRLGTAQKRRALRNFLYANPGGFEGLLAFELHEGLKELELGWLTPLLRPTKPKSHSRLRWIRCRLGAICFIEHERGKGKKKSEAKETAANEFGIDVETIQTWENRLPKELGQLEVARWRQFAYNTGTHVLADPQYRGLANYGLENLRFCAREYKAMKKERALRRGKKPKQRL
jgi:hypothetical protein